MPDFCPSPLLSQIFQELHKGQTRFSLRLAHSCQSCHNVRLLKVTHRQPNVSPPSVDVKSSLGMIKFVSHFSLWPVSSSFSFSSALPCLPCWVLSNLIVISLAVGYSGNSLHSLPRCCFQCCNSPFYWTWFSRPSYTAVVRFKLAFLWFFLFKCKSLYSY